MVEPTVSVVHVHYQRSRHVLCRLGRRHIRPPVVPESTYLLFVTGFLGGFSTFSTAINEMVSLARNRHLAMAAFYVLVTIVVPVICVALGWIVGSLAH